MIIAKAGRRSNYFRKVDNRFLEVCVKNLPHYPVGVCEEGKKRVEWLKSHKNASTEEENNAPGCPYGIKTNIDGSYCMFKFLSSDKNLNNHQQYPTQNTNTAMSYYDIAEATGLSVDQVMRAEISATAKLRAIPEMAELFHNSLSSRMYDGIGYFEEGSSMDGFYLDLRDFDVDALMDLGDEGFFSKNSNSIESNTPSNIG
jgi:hypothetical protein